MTKKDYHKYFSLKFSLIILSLIVITTACLEQKNTAQHRAFHNLTSRFNAYYYANKMIKEERAMFIKKYVDDYDKVLSIYMLGTPEQATQLYPIMDTAIKKCLQDIEWHSIKDKGVEQVRWIDNCWMTIGKAQFYKHNWQEADKVFNYVVDNYENSEAIFEGRLWVANTALQTNRNDKAISMLTKLEQRLDAQDKEEKKGKEKSSKSKKKKSSSRNKWKTGGRSNKNTQNKKVTEYDLEIPDELIPFIHATYAAYYLKKEDYGNTIEKLEKALEAKPPKLQKARWNFILGQLYQKESRFEEARDHYKKAARYSVNYDMIFHAKIFSLIAVPKENRDLKDIRKELITMSKDPKNEPYLDLIYYGLAEISFREGNEDDGIAYLEKSVSYASNSKDRKAKSFLRLAEYFYQDKVYKKAQVYYDSAYHNIPETADNYSEIELRATSLNQLLVDFITVKTEDSLQMVAKMEPAEREVFIQELIQKQKEEEERIRREAEQRMMAQAQAAANTKIKSKVAFYFDNQTLVAQGLIAFKQKWGDRENRDFWRIDVESFNYEENIVDEDTAKEKVNELDKYLAELPLTPEAIRKSDSLIIDALYDAGMIFKEKINDNEQAIKTFLKLLERYPKTKYTYSTYYQLYRLYQDKNMGGEAEKYKNRLLKECPECEGAKIINDPDYLKKKAEEALYVQDDYNDLYNSYKWGNYTKVVKETAKIISTQKDNPYLLQYHVLQILALRELKEIDAYKKALKDLISRYPDTEQAKLAKTWLAVLEKPEEPKPTKKSGAQKQKVKYVYKENEMHFFILLVPSTNKNVNSIKIAVSDFNKKYFQNMKLRVTSVLMGKDYHVVTISPFKESKSSLKYYMAFQQNKDVVSKYNGNLEYFVINKNNYRNFYKAQDIEGYLEFFDKEYLKK